MPTDSQSPVSNSAPQSESQSAHDSSLQAARKLPWWRRWLRRIGVGIVWIVLAGMTLWAAVALYFDFPWRSLHAALAVFYVIAVSVAAWFARRRMRRWAVCLAGFLLVLAWWLSLKPSNHRDWQADVAQTPYAEIHGDTVTIHNFRDCDYRAEFDYTCQWLTKEVHLSKLSGIDVFVTYWGSPWIAHPIVSFDFGDEGYVAASIETRKEVGEEYSAILGFFRQYELIYIFSDERDLVRLRSNFRKDEDVHIFHTTAGPEWSRKLFLQYIERANDMHVHPQWYNAMTDNCTTNIFTQMAATGELPQGTSLHDWWILLNGRGTEAMYRTGNFAGDGLAFPILMEKSFINPYARTITNSPDFSRLIRVGRPGFGAASDAPAQK